MNGIRSTIVADEKVVLAVVEHNVEPATGANAGLSITVSENVAHRSWDDVLVVPGALTMSNEYPVLCQVVLEQVAILAHGAPSVICTVLNQFLEKRSIQRHL